MPQPLMPGVAIEEGGVGRWQIDGVPTSITGFVGPAREGPLRGPPAVVRSLAEFERQFGDGRPLVFGGAGEVPNHLWHAARAFFTEGGTLLHVARVFRPVDAARADDGCAAAADWSAGGLTVRARDPGAAANGWRVRLALRAAADGAAVVDVSRVSAADGRVLDSWAGVPIDPARAARDSLFDRFAAAWPATVPPQPAPPLVIVREAARLATAADVATLLFGADAAPLADRLARGLVAEAPLAGGHDGRCPDADTVEGEPGEGVDTACGLRRLEAIDEIAIVAAPGSSAHDALGGQAVGTIAQRVVAHAERVRHRIAVLDSGRGSSVEAVRALRGTLSSSRAALYHPWLCAADPFGGGEILLPPSGFVAGLYARVDAERGVHKAPANEVVRGASGLEQAIGAAQQERLNPEGINCIRLFPGRGIRVWGARTLAADAEWKYVNVRRFMIFVERSIALGLQRVVFEPHGEPLWATVRRTVEDFLLGQWRQGALQGDRPEAAFFVRCDRTTMTQADLDAGRLVCEIGLAPLKPAEFIVIRIGLHTADAAG